MARVLTIDDLMVRDLTVDDPMARDPKVGGLIARDLTVDDPMRQDLTARDLRVADLMAHRAPVLPANRIADGTTSLTMPIAVPHRSVQTRPSIAWTRMAMAVCRATSSTQSPHFIADSKHRLDHKDSAVIADLMGIGDPVLIVGSAARRSLIAVPATCAAAVLRGLAKPGATFKVRNDSKAGPLGHAPTQRCNSTAGLLVRHRGFNPSTALAAPTTAPDIRDHGIAMPISATTIRATNSDHPRGIRTIAIEAMQAHRSPTPA